MQMQDMSSNGISGLPGQNYHSEIEPVGSGIGRSSFGGPSSGPLTIRASRKYTRFDIPESSTVVTSSSGSSNNNSNNNQDAYVEIVLHVCDESVAVHSIRNAGSADEENPGLTKGLDKRSLSGLSDIFQNASFRYRQVSEVLKRLAPLTKLQTPGRLDRTNPAATNALKGLKFITKTDGDGWAAVAKKFDELTAATTNGLLTQKLFGECIGMEGKSGEFAARLFNALARRRNIKADAINKAQLKEFWDQMADEDFDSRLQTFFHMVDKDADGRITEAEVREIIELSASANKLMNLKNQADEYAALIMEEFDLDNLGYIMIESLEMLLLRGGSQISSQMPSKKFRTTDNDNTLRKWHQNLKFFLQDNWQRAWVLVLWIAAMAGLFAWKYLQYRNKDDVYEVMGHCVCMAKGAAETLKLNMALILLPVCRNTITWLRTKTKLGKAIPFNDNINFHQMVAVGIAFGVGIHAFYHLSCDFPRLLHASEEKYEPMKKYFGEQPSNYWYFVRGWEGITGIILVVLMAIAFTLATPWLRRGEKHLPKLLKKCLPERLKKLTGFNTFWYSHHLFVIVYACLIIHGVKLYFTKEWYKKTTWMYIAVPVTLYGGERLIRTFRSRIKAVKIRNVVVHPEKVLALYMSKPKNFKYNSGQYLFIKCVAISPFEWHPFSITSAPGDDYLSVHIQNSGDWTKQLTVVFSEICQPTPYGDGGLLRAECIQGSKYNFPRVLMDGPYGAPSQDYKKYEVVLLVGLGIGATPMISIVKDIVNNMKAMEEEKKGLENGFFSREGSPLPTNSPSPMIPKSKKKPERGGEMFKIKKVYFYWVTREQGSFDWFKEVMNEVAELDNESVIEMHNYCTSVYEEADARAALIEMIQSMNHAKNQVDVVSGTPFKSHFAKPKWPDVYNRIALNHPGSKVGVFYCGIPAAVKELKQLASDFTHNTSTRFDFHKENF